MTESPLVVVACVAAWVACGSGAGRHDARVRLVRWSARAPSTASSQLPASVESAFSPALRAVGSAGAAMLTYVVLGTGLGLVVAPFVGVFAWFSLARLEPAARRRRRARAERELPVAADLLSTCLRAGATLERALRIVGDAVGGVVGAEFVRAAAAIVLGAPTAEAVGPWSSDPALVALEPLARTMIRSTTSGSAPATAMAQLALDLRAARRWQVDEVARRVGVRSAAPLGVCFLPAFVLLGVVPVVIDGARTVGF